MFFSLILMSNENSWQTIKRYLSNCKSLFLVFSECYRRSDGYINWKVIKIKFYLNFWWRVEKGSPLFPQFASTTLTATRSSLIRRRNNKHFNWICIHVFFDLFRSAQPIGNFSGPFSNHVFCLLMEESVNCTISFGQIITLISILRVWRIFFNQSFEEGSEWN